MGETGQRPKPSYQHGMSIVTFTSPGPDASIADALHAAATWITEQGQVIEETELIESIMSEWGDDASWLIHVTIHANRLAEQIALGETV